MAKDMKKEYRLIYTPLEDGTPSRPIDKAIHAKNKDEAKAMAQEKFKASGIPEALANGDLWGCLFFLMDGRALVKDFLWDRTDRQPRLSHVFTIHDPAWDSIPDPPPLSKAIACLDGGISEALAYASYQWQILSPKEKMRCMTFELDYGGICIRDFVAEQRQETIYIEECLKNGL